MMNIKKIGFLVLPLLVLSFSLFKYRKFPSLLDYSVEKSFIHGRQYKVHLVTYSGGSEVHFRNQNTLIQTAINKGFDVFHAYNEKHLDASFNQKNKKILEQKRGAGYGNLM